MKDCGNVLPSVAGASHYNCSRAVLFLEGPMNLLPITCVCHSVCPAAGNAFCQAARIHMQLQNKHDSATSFIDAGNAFKKSDPNGETHNQPISQCGQQAG